MEGVEFRKAHSAMMDGRVSWTSERGEFVRRPVFGGRDVLGSLNAAALDLPTNGEEAPTAESTAYADRGRELMRGTSKIKWPSGIAGGPLG